MTRKRTHICKVCTSKNLQEYINAKNQGFSYRQLEDLALRYSEDIAYIVFYKHFKAKIEERDKESSTIKDTQSELEDYLKMIKKNIDTVQESINKEGPTESRIKALTNLIKEARLTVSAIEQALLKTQSKKDIEINRLLAIITDLLRDVDPSKLEEVETRLKSVVDSD